MTRRKTTERISKEDALANQTRLNSLLGGIHGLYLGHSTDLRLRSSAASGGIISALSRHLLAENQVDAVVTVGHTPDDPIKPQYLVLRSVQDVDACAGSIYTYIRPKLLKDALDSCAGQRVAVVCQPCLVKLAKNHAKADVCCVLSFFCGYNMEFGATEYLLRQAKVAPRDVARLEYRGGPYPGGFWVTRKDGTVTGFGKECYELVNLRFLRPGCERCTLYMGEAADIALGDAWLRGQRDMNVLLARTERGVRLLQQGLDADMLQLYECNAQSLLDMHWHNLKYKRFGHGMPMKLILWMLRDVLPEPLVPFKLLVWLSKQRRKRKIGIDFLVLNPVTKLDTASPGTDETLV